MPRLLYSVFIVFVAYLVGCGLNERERAVSETNEAILAVEAASQTVAERINALPDRPLTADDTEAVRGALSSYMELMDQLNASMRRLSEHYNALQPYLAESFRPAAEAAASACQEALDTLGGDSVEQEEIRRALTRVGLCLERYATAVTNVAAEYARVQN